VDRLAHLALVLHDHAGVDDRRVADAGFGDDRSVGPDDHVAPQRGGGGDERRRVDGADELEPLGGERGGVLPAGAVVADRDDRVRHPLLLPQLRQHVRRPEHRHPADLRAGEPRVGIDEPDRVVPPGRAQDVEHDLAVSARADDDDRLHR
jgi:hypothetical protein